MSLYHRLTTPVIWTTYPNPALGRFMTELAKNWIQSPQLLQESNRDFTITLVPMRKNRKYSALPNALPYSSEKRYTTIAENCVELYINRYGPSSQKTNARNTILQ